MTEVRKVVVFGASGEGKSSLIKAVMDELKTVGRRPAVGKGVKGETLGSEAYRVSFDDNAYNLIDTAGLNESSEGTVSPITAVQNLVHLLKEIKTGVAGIVMVVKNGKILAHHQKNYKLIFETILESNPAIPRILVVTNFSGSNSVQKAADYNSLCLENGMKFDSVVLGTFGFPDEEDEEVKAVLRRKIPVSVRLVLDSITANTADGNVEISVGNWSSYFIRIVHKTLSFLATIFSFGTKTGLDVGNFIAEQLPMLVPEWMGEIATTANVPPGSVISEFSK